MTARQEELISRFLSDALSAEDQAEINVLQSEDRNFKEHFAGLQIALRREVLRRKHLKPHSFYRRYRYWIWTIFTGLGLLAIAAWWQQTNKPVPQAGVLMAYGTYKPLTNFTDMSTAPATMLNDFEALFNKEKPTPADYTQALQIIREVQKDASLAPDLRIKCRFFEGICLLESGTPGNYAEAEAIFRSVLQNPIISEMKPGWFLALSLAAQGKWEASDREAAKINAGSNKHLPVNEFRENSQRHMKRQN